MKIGNQAGRSSKTNKEKIENEELEELTSAMVSSMEDCKMDNVVARDCPGGYFASKTIIGTGSSSRHITGSAEKLCIMLKQKYNIIPSLDTSSKEWVIVVCWSIVAHFMTQEKRDLYRIEDLISEISKKNSL